MSGRKSSPAVVLLSMFILLSISEAKPKETVHLYDIRVGDKYGYINYSGEMVIQPVYSRALPFSEGLAAVCLQNDEVLDYGFIDRSGKMVIPPMFGYSKLFKGFKDGLAMVQIETYIDATGKIVWTPKPQ
jgi:hypothetical protein